MSRLAMRTLILAGAALVAVACSANAEVTPPAMAPAASYQAGIVPLLESNCATCHLTGEEAGGISLVGDAAIDFLVGKPAQEAPALMRIVAGDPDKSYLVMKLEGTHLANGGTGAQMPFGAPPLAPEKIALIRQWIAEGAKP